MDLKEAKQQKDEKLHNEEPHNCYASSDIISLCLSDKGGCDGVKGKCIENVGWTT
jgi:hypothetical protein